MRPAAFLTTFSSSSGKRRSASDGAGFSGGDAGSERFGGVASSCFLERFGVATSSASSSGASASDGRFRGELIDLEFGFDFLKLRIGKHREIDHAFDFGQTGRAWNVDERKIEDQEQMKWDGNGTAKQEEISEPRSAMLLPLENQLGALQPEAARLGFKPNLVLVLRCFGFVCHSCLQIRTGS
mgnify:CR=1 FL=1